MKTNNILFVFSNFFPGGPKRQLLSLLKYLDRKKFSPVICCLKNEGELAEDFRTLGVKVVAINMKSRYDFRVLLGLLKILEDEKINVVRTVGGGDSMFWGILSSLISNIPVRISSLHRIDYPSKGRCMKFPNRLLIPFVSKIIAVANAQKESLIEAEGVPRGKIQVIYNGVDSDRFTSANCQTSKDLREIANGRKIIGIIASLKQEKRHDIFLESAVEVLKEFPETNFWIIGDGPLEVHIKELIKKRNLESEVRMLGKREDIPEIIRLLHVSALTSDTEVLPNSLLESLAMGIPVVATAVGGVPEIVHNGYNGFLVAPNNPTLLAEAIKKILRSPDLGKKMGENGQQFVIKHFDIRTATRKYENLFLTLLDKAN